MVASTKIDLEHYNNEYYTAKIRLQKLKWWKIGLIIVAILMCAGMSYSLYNPTRKFITTDDLINALFIFVIASICLIFCISLLFDSITFGYQRRIIAHEAKNIQENMENDYIANSIQMSYKYLDQYYLQTREQAKNGFIATMWVGAFGAMLIAAGVILVFIDKVEPSYVASIAGVITEFIAAIFFYLYNRTVASMSLYHNKLVIVQNVAIALKTADTLPEAEQAKIKGNIIIELTKDINSFLFQDPSGQSNQKKRSDSQQTTT